MSIEIFKPSTFKRYIGLVCKRAYSSDFDNAQEFNYLCHVLKFDACIGRSGTWIKLMISLSASVMVRKVNSNARPIPADFHRGVALVSNTSQKNLTAESLYRHNLRTLF